MSHGPGKYLIDNEFWKKYYVQLNEYNITQEIVDEFRFILDSNPEERVIQKFLNDNPWFFYGFRMSDDFVLPQFKLGNKYITDYLIASHYISGSRYTMVELEKAEPILLTKGGKLSRYVKTPLDQITEWRTFINENTDYCNKSRISGGLGLMNTMFIDYVIIIGREYQYTPEFRSLIGDKYRYGPILIQSYDRLLDRAQDIVNIKNQKLQD